MLRPFGRRFAVVLIAAWYIAASFPAAAEDEQTALDQITLEQIAARLAQWRGSFVNVRVVYDLRSLPPSDDPVVDWSSPPPEPDSAPRFAQTEWIWADHGLNLMDDRGFYWTPGKVGHRDIDVFNGPKGVAFRAYYRKSLEQIEDLKELRLQGLGVGKPISAKGVAAVHGLYWPDTVEWLPDKLAQWECRLDGIEQMFGEACARITARYPDGSDTDVDELWLDLKHGCLPRRYTTLPNSHRKVGIDFVVDEFQQLEGGVWFPKRGRLQLQTKPAQNQLFVITEAAINETLDMSRFDPPQPEKGTSVSDRRFGTSQQLGQSATLQRQVADSNASSTAQSPSAIAPIPWGTGWTVTMICVSFAFLAIGLWMRKK